MLSRYYTISILSLLSMSSCTLSFNNISTRGQASDVVDSVQKADADIEPDLTIPAL